MAKKGENPNAKKKPAVKKKSKAAAKRLKKDKTTGGRPEIIVTPEMIENAGKFAALGMTNDQIAWSLGIAPSTLFKKKNENSDLEDAIEKGKAKGILAVANAHFVEATQHGNVIAQQFFLSRRGGWHDTNKVELTGKNGGPIEVTNSFKHAVANHGAKKNDVPG